MIGGHPHEEVRLGQVEQNPSIISGYPTSIISGAQEVQLFRKLLSALALTCEGAGSRELERMRRDLLW
jgi:hypothetical protein